MVFPHSFPLISNSYFEFLDLLDHLKEGLADSSSQAGETAERCLADQRMAVLEKAGICDKNAQPYQNIAWPILSSHLPLDWVVIKRVIAALQAPQEILLKIPSDTQPQKVSIKFSLLDIFHHIFFYTQAAGIPIGNIEWIGRSVIGLLRPSMREPHVLIRMCQQVFPALDPSLINNWFQSNAIQHYLQQEGSDIDIRLWINVSSEKREALNDTLINFLVSRIPSDALNLKICRQELVKKRASYDQQLRSSFDIQKACLIEFKGVKQMTSIFKQDDRSTVLSLGTTGKSIDFLQVELLKDNQVFSSDSLTLVLNPLIHELIWPTGNPCGLFLTSGNFSASKFFIDLFGQISTVSGLDKLTHTHIFRLLDNHTRFSQGTKYLVAALFENKSTIIREKYKGQTDNTDSYYAYFLLKEYMEKHPNHLPSILMAFKFCQLLQRHRAMSDQDLFRIWHLMDQAGLLSIPQHCPLFYRNLKQSLLGENIPFSQVCAWIELWGSLFHSSAGSHIDAPSLWLTIPHTQHMLQLPAKPLEALQRLTPISDYSLTQMKALLSLYQSFIPPNAFANANHQFEQFGSVLIAHENPLTSLIGLCLMLGACSNNPQIAIIQKIFKHLHKPLCLGTQMLPFLDHIELLCQQLQLSGHQKAIQLFKASSSKGPSFEEVWMQSLCQAEKQELALISSEMLRQRLNKKQKTSPALISSILIEVIKFNCSKALSLYKAIPMKDWPDESALNIFHRLCHPSTKAHYSIFEWQDLGRIAMGLVERQAPSSLKKDESKRSLSKTFAHLIAHLHGHATLQSQGDELLLQTSHLGYFTDGDCSSAWMLRLEQLLKNTSTVVLSAALFKLAKEKGFLKQADAERLQVFEIQLARHLIQGPNQQLGSALLQALTGQTLQESSQQPFGLLLACSLGQEIAKKNVSASTIGLIEKTIQILPANSAEARSLFGLFAEYLSKNDVPSDLLSEVDRVLIYGSSRLGLSSHPGVIGYLDRSFKTSMSSRLPNILNLLQLNLDSGNLSRSFLCLLVKIVQAHSPAPLPASFICSLSNSQIAVLNGFKQNGLTAEAKLFCTLLEAYRIDKKAAVSDILWIAQAEFSPKTPEKALSAARFLATENVQKMQIPLSEMTFLQELSEALINHPNALEAYPWIEWLLTKESAAISAKTADLMSAYMPRLLQANQALKAQKLLLISTYYPDNLQPPIISILSHWMAVHDLKAALQLITAYPPKDASIWRDFFEATGALDHEIVRQAWNIFKPLSHAASKECWAAVLKSLAMIRHPDAVDYLNYESFFEGALNIQLHRQLILSAIVHIPYEDGNDQILLEIMAHLQRLRDVIGQDCSSLAPMEKEIALALALHLSKSPLAAHLRGAAEWPKQVDPEENREAFSTCMEQILKSMLALKETSVDLQKSVLNCLEIGINKSLFASDVCLKLVPLLVKIAVPSFVKAALHLASKILKDNPMRISNISGPFIDGLALAIDQQQPLDLVEFCLEKGLIMISNASRKLNSLPGCYLKAYLTQQAQHCTNAEQLETAIVHYNKWLPKVLDNRDARRECVQLIVSLIESGLNRPYINASQLKGYTKTLFNLKKFVTSKLFKEHSIAYANDLLYSYWHVETHLWTMVKTISVWFCNAIQEGQFTPEEAIQFIDCYLSQAIAVEVIEEKNFIESFFSEAKKIVNICLKQGYFKDFQEKLYEYNLKCNLDYKTTLHDQQKIPVIMRLFHSHIKEKNPENILKAIDLYLCLHEICDVKNSTPLVETSKILFDLFEKQPFIKHRGKLLFIYFRSSIIPQGDLASYSIPSRKRVREILTMGLTSINKILQQTSKVPCQVEDKLFYLKIKMQMLASYYRFEGFKHARDYFQTIEALMPSIKEAHLSCPPSDDLILNALYEEVKRNLSNAFIGAILTPIESQPEEAKMQKDLLFQWLNFLEIGKPPTSNNSIMEQVLCLIHVLNQIAAMEKTSQQASLILLDELLPMVSQVSLAYYQYKNILTDVSKQPISALQQRLLPFVNDLPKELALPEAFLTTLLAFKGTVGDEKNKHKQLIMKCLTTLLIDPEQGFYRTAQAIVHFYLHRLVWSGCFNEKTPEEIQVFESCKEWLSKYSGHKSHFMLEYLHIKFYDQSLSQNFSSYISLVEQLVKSINQFHLLNEWELADYLIPLILKKAPSDKFLFSSQIEAFHHFLRIWGEALCSVKPDHPNYFKLEAFENQYLIYLQNGIDCGLINSQSPEIAEQFQIIKEVILVISQFESTKALMELIELELFAASKMKENIKLYCETLENLMPRLRNYVFRMDNFFLSMRIVDMIKNISDISNVKRRDLFLTWLNLLTEEARKSKDTERLDVLKTHIIIVIARAHSNAIINKDSEEFCFLAKDAIEFSKQGMPKPKQVIFFNPSDNN